MIVQEDRVFETSTTTGTGNLTLLGPASRYVSFASVAPTQDDFFTYLIEHRTINEWEIGWGYMLDSTTLVRDLVLRSTNSNNAVNFSTGTKNVTICAPARYVYRNPRAMYWTLHDFQNGNGSVDWVWSNSSVTVSAIATGSINANGVMQVSTGTSSSSRSTIALQNNVVAGWRLDLGYSSFRTRWVPDLVSDGTTHAFTTRIGFIDAFAGESVDGVFFRYNHTINSGQWQCVTRSNSSESVVNTTVAYTAGTWRRFEITVNRQATRAQFMIDGAVVGTITTNIPVGAGRELTAGVSTIRTVGTTSTAWWSIDFAEAAQYFTTLR